MSKRKLNSVYEYTLYDAASDTSKCLVKGCPRILKGKHGANLLRHFLAHHPELYAEILGKNAKIKSIKQKLSSSAQDSSEIPQQSTSKFGIVRKACIDLVKIHGYAVSLFDCTAFKEILNVVNMTPHEKKRISSKHIERSVTSQGDETIENDEEASSDTGRENGVENEVVEDATLPTKRTIKSESIVCSCSADDSTTKHLPDCPAASTPAYYNHFEVSVDKATCLICRRTIKWTNILQLKLHLVSEHPTTPYKDDDEAFEPVCEEAADSSVGSQDDIEEVYLDVNSFENETKTLSEPPAKRRKDNPFKNLDKYSQEENAKASEELRLTLDRFGLYIAALLKYLPSDKRIKFQSEIVQRLLAEQSSSAA